MPPTDPPPHRSGPSVGASTPPVSRGPSLERAALVRPAAAGDLDALVDLAWDVAAEGRWIGAEVPFDRAARRRRYEEMGASPDAAVLVADDGGGVAGVVTVSVAPYGVADLAMMVAADRRGQGIGTALLDAATAWAAGAGAHKLWLEVWPHNAAAIALYRRAGFVEEGRKRRHYRRRNGELWDSVLMGRAL